ncbi:hypothetical protein HG531_001843 [Fusarium graminearum]|nr:hypothetical protein HG531_001843 [Fusarium graminearum]
MNAIDLNSVFLYRSITGWTSPAQCSSIRSNAGERNIRRFGTKCQDHLEMMDQKNMDAEIKQCFDRGRREVFEQATSIDEDGEAAEESVEQGLLVAGARAINPPEAKYAEDESSQDGQLP